MDRNAEGTGPARGSSEVHSELTAQPSKGVASSGKYDAGDAATLDRAKERIGEATDRLADTREDATSAARGRIERLRDRVEDARDDLTDRAQELQNRAQESYEDARREASRIRDRARDRTDRLLDGSGARQRIDDHPLIALGLAFGLGYLIAGPGGEKAGMRGKVRAQMRTAIIGAASAAAAQQARSLLGLESGHAGGLGSLADSALGTQDSAGTSAAGGQTRAASAYGA